jgi:lipocalin
MYDNDLAALTFEHNAVCVTADYAVNAPRNISVFNANRVKHPNGQLNTIEGYAIQSLLHEAELAVSFSGSAPGAPC